METPRTLTSGVGGRTRELSDRGPAQVVTDSETVVIGFAFVVTITVVIALFIAWPGCNAATAVAFDGFVGPAAINTIKRGAIVTGVTGPRPSRDDQRAPPPSPELVILAVQRRQQDFTKSAWLGSAHNRSMAVIIRCLPATHNAVLLNEGTREMAALGGPALRAEAVRSAGRAVMVAGGTCSAVAEIGKITMLARVAG